MVLLVRKTYTYFGQIPLDTNAVFWYNSINSRGIMEWIIFILYLVVSGLWTKRVNTLHMRKLAQTLKEKHNDIR